MDRRAKLGCVAAVAVAPFLYLLWAWALRTLWGWYVEPAFGLKTPALLTCIGLLLIVSLFYKDDPVSAKTTEKTVRLEGAGKCVVQAFAQALLRPLLAVVFGWLWKLVL